MKFAPSENYQAAAEKIFSELRGKIREKLPSATIEHIGSTAIPNCLTKGDLDLVVSVSQQQFPHALETLDSMFCPNTGSDRNREFAAFVLEGQELPVGIQLVAAGLGGDTFVAWRELLLESQDILKRYNELKASHRGSQMDQYRADKSEFIENELRLSKSEKVHA